MTMTTSDPLHGFENHAKRPIIPIEVGTVVAYTMEFLRDTGHSSTLRGAPMYAKRGQVQSIDENGLMWVSWAGEEEARPCKAYALVGCKGPFDTPCGTRDLGSDPYEAPYPGAHDHSCWMPEQPKHKSAKSRSFEVIMPWTSSTYTLYCADSLHEANTTLIQEVAALRAAHANPDHIVVIKGHCTHPDGLTVMGMRVAKTRPRDSYDIVTREETEARAKVIPVMKQVADILAIREGVRGESKSVKDTRDAWMSCGLDSKDPKYLGLMVEYNMAKSDYKDLQHERNLALEEFEDQYGTLLDAFTKEPDVLKWPSIWDALNR